MMDLREIDGTNKNRHPWEVSRLKALRSLVKDFACSGANVIDIGCGDGYVCGELFRGMKTASVTGVDINLGEGGLKRLRKAGDGVIYLNKYPPQGRLYDIVLLLDVVEHVKDDMEFLRDIAESRLGSAGRVLMTAPAFQSLYGSHDRFLRHYRRYSLPELKALAESAGLAVLSGGYLFSLLLLPRYVSVRFGKIFNPGGSKSRGVGAWSHGAVMTWIAVKILDADNAVNLALCRLGVRLPGLTAWVICSKRPR